MSVFETRALEIHSSRMWRWATIEEAIKTMRRSQMNTLVLHQNDLIDALVFPSEYISQEMFYARWPILRSRLILNRLYLQQVIEVAAANDINVFLEVKEFSYPEPLIQIHPELLGPNGAVCPTHPLLLAYTRAKVNDLYLRLPGLSGLIVSIATRESKASIATGACDCERCAHTDHCAWYESVIRGFHIPSAAAGKQLVVRDFAYSSDEQGVLVPAAKRVSSEIVMALKVVPHDFWPTFPDNPMIGHSDGLKQWVEYDVFGQYSGTGVVPSGLLDDIRARFQNSANKGASGVILRTDWELIDEVSAFSSLNMVNVWGAALLARDLGTTDADIISLWLTEGIRTATRPESTQEAPVPILAQAAREALTDLMRSSWDVLRGTSFTRGHVFQYSSKLPPTLKDLFYVALGYHGREQWDPGSSDLVTPTSHNVAEIMREKQCAYEKVVELTDRVRLGIVDLPGPLRRELESTLDLFVLYVDMFRSAISAAFLVALALQGEQPEDRHRAADAIGDFDVLRDSVASVLRRVQAPFYVRGIFSAELLTGFAQDLRDRLRSEDQGEYPSRSS